jgi:hypothetical protein
MRRLAMRRLVPVGMVALLLAGVAAAAAVSLQGSDGGADTGGTSTVPPAPLTDESPWSHLMGRMRAAGLSQAGAYERLAPHFALVRGEPERLDASTPRYIQRALQAPTGAIRFDGAQLIQTAHGRLWLVAGRGLACIVSVPKPAFACESIKWTTRRGLYLGTVDGVATGTAGDQRFVTIGIVPDSVRAVRFQPAPSVPARLRPRDNVIALEAQAVTTVRALVRDGS